MIAARSIRVRLLCFAVAGTVAALAIAGLGLAQLFDRHLERRVAQELDALIIQLASNLRRGTDGVYLTVEPNDGRFYRPLSGYYWQVTGDDGQLLRSRSLWDAELDAPRDATDEAVTRAITAQDGKPALQRDRRVIVGADPGGEAVVISAAVDRSEIDALGLGFIKDLLPGLLALGLLMLFAAWLQVNGGLRPLNVMQADIARIRAGKLRRLEGVRPAEVEPLVTELNALLDAQDAEMVRARDRAADLAHGLRTPLTALAGDVVRLRREGHDAIAAELAEVGGQMQRIVERELARARVRHGRRLGESTAVLPPAEAVIRTLRRTPAGESLCYEIAIPPQTMLPIDGGDLLEILGNIAENAVRAARSGVRISARDEANGAWLAIEDDGVEVDPAAVANLAKRGVRADKRGSAGLGLAIVAEILDSYEAGIEFSRSPMGGLKVLLVFLPIGR